MALKEAPQNPTDTPSKDAEPSNAVADEFARKPDAETSASAAAPRTGQRGHAGYDSAQRVPEDQVSTKEMLSDEALNAAADILANQPPERQAEMLRVFRQKFSTQESQRIEELVRQRANRSKAGAPNATLPHVTDHGGTLESIRPTEAITEERDAEFIEAKVPGGGRWPLRHEGNVLKAEILEGNTKGGITLRRNFELQEASRDGGFIIQEVTITYQEIMPDGSLSPMRTMYHYWEAWRIDRNAKSPTERLSKPPYSNDSIGFQFNPGGQHGIVGVSVQARFYEGLQSLPPQFKRNKKPQEPGYDPRIDPADKLQATADPFELSPNSYRSVTPWENDAIYTKW